MKTILIAEDEREIAQAIKLILEDEGYRVLLCANGVEARDQLRKEKPDLVISDIMMPLASGYDVLKSIQETPSLQGLPTILMSCVKPTVPQANYGWRKFLRKPFNIDDLVGAVHEVLGA